MPYLKPLPFVTDDGKPFWDGCKKHHLLVQKCRDCGNVQFPPRVMCTSCLSMSLEWIKISGKGKIYTYTIVHRPPSKAFAPDVPYIIALIDLDEGVRIMSNVVNCQSDEVKIGLQVEATFFEATDDITLPLFKPIREQEA